ncbi:MAG: tRNA1(Val) (adenine(37)-N6)-methyltransferase [Myxococcota bacterium]|nr:tRNA1(Val) (adenine(37)-N6)-methyltransferase [Myxococcota bacterium]
MLKTAKEAPAPETTDGIFGGALRVIQGRNGYRFSVDALLLARFASHETGTGLDLGAGSGVISLALTRASKAEFLYAIEIQKELADRAQRSVSLNGLEDRVNVLHGDFRRIGDHLPPLSVDFVVANPPYQQAASGRVNPNTERAIARHEIEMTLDDMMAAACHVLRGRGRLYVIYPAQALGRLFESARRARLAVKRLQFVHGHADDPAKMVLAELMKDGKEGLTVESPIVLFQHDGAYAPEIGTFLRTGVAAPPPTPPA